MEQCTACLQGSEIKDYQKATESKPNRNLEVESITRPTLLKMNAQLKVVGLDAPLNICISILMLYQKTETQWKTHYSQQQRGSRAAAVFPWQGSMNFSSKVRFLVLFFK